MSDAEEPNVDEIEALLAQAKQAAEGNKPSASAQQSSDAGEQPNVDEIEALLAQSKRAAGGDQPSESAQQSSDADEQPNVNEIEALLAQAKRAAEGESASAESSAPANTAAKTQSAASQAGVATAPKPREQAERSAPHSSHDDINMLLQHAQQALDSIDKPTVADLQGIAPFQFQDFTAEPPSSEKATLDLLRDVELDLKIELGRTHMQLEEILKLRKGAVVPLDKLAGDPVDVYVNGRLVARGEVLVLNDNFCVRVAQLLTGEEAA